MKKIFVCFLLLISFSGLRAQNRDSTYRFSLKQSIDFALQNQKDVVNAGLDADISHAKVRYYEGIGLPQLNASLDVKDFEKIPTQFIPDFITPSVYNVLFDEHLLPRRTLDNNGLFPVQFGTRWNATANVSASQLLFDPSYLVGLQAARTFSELSHKNIQRSRIETAVNVSKAYYNTLLVNKRKDAIDANVIRIKKLRDDTKALYENGFVEKLDLDRVQLAYNNLTSEQEKFNRIVEISSRLLQFQMGMPVSANLELTDTLNAEEIKKTIVPVEKSDPSKRIEYSILQTEKKFQEYNVKRYKVGYYPSLVAYASLSASAQRQQFDFLESGKKWYPTGIIGATLNIPLFDGLQKAAQIRQEKLTLRKINNELANFEEAVELDIRSNRNSLLDAISSLQNQEKNLELANEIYRVSKLKYDQGVGSNLEVMNAETSLKEAEANYYNSMFDAVVARINLDKAMGNIAY